MGITKVKDFKWEKIMEKVFNKLVRDRIPEIIRNNNEEAITRILNDDEYKKALENKLLEEYNEVLTATEGNDYIEELADMLEVIDALASTQNKSLEDIIKIKEEKLNKRGGFKKKLFLERTR